MTISLAGEVRQEPTVGHVASVSQLAPKFSELYFTRSVAGIGNLYAYSFATRKERQVSGINRGPRTSRMAAQSLSARTTSSPFVTSERPTSI